MRASALKIFSFLPKDQAVRLSDGRNITNSFAIVGNYCLQWRRDVAEDPTGSISALISSIRPLPELIVIGSEAKFADLKNLPCSVEQTDSVLNNSANIKFN